MMPTFPKVGLDALLTPENCAVLLIDHQPSQLANVNSHDPTLVINSVGAIFTNVFIVPASPVIHFCYCSHRRPSHGPVAISFESPDPHNSFLRGTVI